MTFTLSPTIILPQPPWRFDDSLRKVMAALGGMETPPQTLIVGGAVRNALLGRAIVDYDLATAHRPDDVVHLAGAAGLKVAMTGFDHGTVTVIADGRGFEVTTLRRDIETDGRHARVSYTDDWRVDASRRDFTLNTLLADFAGHIYDPLGCGVADAQAGRVRFVGDASARLEEDYLRLLRFFRFHAVYGRGDPDPVAVAACAAAAPHLHDLSRERVTQEVMKLLGADYPMATIEIANKYNILSYIFKNSLDIDGLRRLVSLQRTCLLPDVVARLVALTRQDGAALRDTLVLSTRQVSWADQLFHARLEPDHGFNSLRRDAARYGVDVVMQRTLMDGCDDISALRDWSPPPCPVTARDLLAGGMAEGPLLGARLRAIQDIWIGSDFMMGRDDLLTATLRLEAST